MCRLDLVLLMGAHPNRPLHMPATQNTYDELVGLMLHNMLLRLYPENLLCIYFVIQLQISSEVSRPIVDISDRLNPPDVAYPFYITTMVT